MQRHLPVVTVRAADQAVDGFEWAEAGLLPVGFRMRTVV
jgi:hypothetical protein